MTGQFFIYGGCISILLGLFLSSFKRDQMVEKLELPESYIEEGWSGRLVLFKRTADGFRVNYYKIGNYELVRWENVRQGIKNE